MRSVCLSRSNPADKTESQNMLMAASQEDGEKLLQFLERRLGLPPALLHRWIRTGQIRVNGGRRKPFCRLTAGDKIRLPPFAECPADLEADAKIALADYENVGLKVIGQCGDILALDKPASLATHGGSKQVDSVAFRLRMLRPGKVFTPVPAHRLDRETSGVLLVASSWQALNFLQKNFAERKIHKEYLCLVEGSWPYARDRTLTHFLGRERVNGFERTCVYETERPGTKKAELIARCLKAGDEHSLLQIRLLTGRKHQIRAQLAYAGHPILGDGKYGHDSGENKIFLHCMAVILPDGHEFACLPAWPAEKSIAVVPETMLTTDMAQNSPCRCEESAAKA